MEKFTLKREKHFMELIDSTQDHDNGAVLKNRLQESGYLFFRGFLKPEALNPLRLDILRILAKHRFLDPSKPVEAGFFAGEPFAEMDEAYFRIYDEVQRLESLHTLKHHETTMGLIKKILIKDVFVHPLAIARLICPRYEAFTTPAHQDYPNNQGSEETYATWIPLGDCPREWGGLSILEGSHLYGVLPNEAALGAGYKRAVLKNRMKRLVWRSTDFKLGDVLVFHSLTVHKALPNKTNDRMRLSVDYRYQHMTEPLTENVMQPHFQRLSWVDIYAGWQSREFQYYWKNLPLNFVPFDNALASPSRNKNLMRRISELCQLS